MSPFTEFSNFNEFSSVRCIGRDFFVFGDSSSSAGLASNKCSFIVKYLKKIRRVETLRARVLVLLSRSFLQYDKKAYRSFNVIVLIISIST